MKLSFCFVNNKEFYYTASYKIYMKIYKYVKLLQIHCQSDKLFLPILFVSQSMYRHVREWIMGNKPGKSISAVTNIYVAYMHTYIYTYILLIYLFIYFIYTSNLKADYDKTKKSNVILFLTLLNDAIQNCFTNFKTTNIQLR